MKAVTHARNSPNAKVRPNCIASISYPLFHTRSNVQRMPLHMYVYIYVYDAEGIQIQWALQHQILLQTHTHQRNMDHVMIVVPVPQPDLMIHMHMPLCFIYQNTLPNHGCGCIPCANTSVAVVIQRCQDIVAACQTV